MMQKLTLDFVKQAPFAFKRLSGLGLLLMVMGLVACAYVLHQANQATLAYQQAEQSLAMLEPAVATKPVAKKKATPALSKKELQQANETAAILDIQWHALLTGLEQLKMRDVALLSIEPNVKKQRLILTGQAKEMQAILNYVAAVETLPMLSRVHLQKHQVEDEVPFKPVSFTILARWL